MNAESLEWDEVFESEIDESVSFYVHLMTGYSDYPKVRFLNAVEHI